MQPPKHTFEIAHFFNFRALCDKVLDKEPLTHIQWTPIHIAADKCNLNIFEYLMDITNSIQPKDINGDTPLHIAVLSGCIEIVKLYLNSDSSANKEPRNNNGNTPLHHAALQNGNLPNDHFTHFLLSF